MHGNEILTTLAGFKETVVLILTWFSWAVVHTIHKLAKWEEVPFRIWVYKTIACWFGWLLAWLWCSAIWIDGLPLHFITWAWSYSWILILDSIDLILWNTLKALKYLRPTVIYELLIDFIMYQVNKWKK